MKFVKLTKRGQVSQLLPLVTSLVAIGITLVIAFLIMSQVKTNSKVVADPNATAAISQVQDAMDDIPEFLSIIVITVIGAILLGLVAFFGISARR